MPFKIVQTSENEQEQLTICPSRWESHGILYWPKKKVRKQIKIEDSLPKDDWSLMKCIVKRKNIPSYEKAEQEIQNMLDYTSSEQEQAASLTTVPVARQNIEDFNQIAKQAVSAATMQDTVYLYAADEVYLDTNAQNLAAVEETMSQVIPNLDNTEEITKNQKVILENQQQIMNNQTLLINNQKQLMQNHDNMMMALAGISVKIDTIITAPSPAVTNLKTMKNSLDNSVFSLKPIRNISELSQLENILEDDLQKSEYISRYGIVCGPEKGINCAYKLCDVIFSRDFLTQCSWSGSTRGEGIKVSLKIFRNVLNLFFSIVHQCDKNYTVAENEKFFKSILKNSTKRHLSKLQRTSTGRNSHKRQKPMSAGDNALDEANGPNEVFVPNMENLSNEAYEPNKENFTNAANVPIEHN